MSRNPAPFTPDEIAGMTFPRDPDWGHLFMRAMATVKQETDENERLRTALEGVLGALSVWRPVQPVPDPTDCSSGYPEWVRKAWSHAIDVLGEK